MSSSSPSSSPSSISSFSLLPFGTVPIPRAILGKNRLGNAGVFASSSMSDMRDVFDQQGILLNYAAYVASQEIRVGGEKEGKRERKDEKRSANEFVSDKDGKGSLYLKDKCIDNEKDEEEEEEEEEEVENGFGRDIRKVQKDRGSKEKKKTTKEKNKPVTILTTLYSDFLPEIKNRKRIQQQIIETPFTFSTFASASTSTSFTSSSFPISSPSSPLPSSSFSSFSSFSPSPTNLPSIKHSLERSFKVKRQYVINLCASFVCGTFLSMDVPFSLRCAFSVEQLMVCGFDDIRRLRGFNAISHVANQN
ncbi:uncharacterized protein MONOS_16293 [Monocercomonoides exilis]|uniref:uncharacterized protein n=1 Tax=Monocercomonoides exilis TaxID=2049356 RepID=UPI00355A50D3|nr:hypothetical protein MONOS_16293 [Monocercomonoides exilis]|eukprot:MONOS_16293.1-p1 / transcript=MONOS_16293.1 / gene=MONOS_16293 / organism=Monocercomonoides_exilis_PA203 / gene_product=unspecified product / transcript_product=unspecified product / location=Mono_scaffold01622:2605-3522(+) / protein_length=306 / sequence_SO=supercontig / SO=protein_coding / is_pseudo=false